MAIKRLSEKNTKSEILSAFEELLQEKQSLEAQIAQKAAMQSVTAKTQNGNGNGTTNGTAIALAEPPPKAVPTTQQKMETIIGSLTQLQLGFGAAVSDLSEKLVQEAIQLQAIRAAVTDEMLQLEALHSLEFNDESLETLLNNYDASAKAFNQELTQKQEEVAQAIAEARKTWQKEQEDYRRQLKERNEDFHKTRQRDQKEYSYDLTLDRKLLNEAYAIDQKQLYQELAELQQIQEKQWAERETAIATREAEFADLKTKVEAIPKELEAAIKRAKEEGKGIATHQAKIKADLLAKEIEGATCTYDLRIESLQDTIQSQSGQLQALSRQLEAALKQVQDLAVKAIESATEANSFNAMREIALEQAKNQAKERR
jgi:predicted amino acid-binding ACT domain protein